MERGILEAGYKIERAKTIAHVWTIIVQALRKLGITEILYIISEDEPPLDIYVLSTLPEQWPKNEVSDPDFFDPFLYYLCATFEISKIGPEFFEDHEYIDERTYKYVEKASAFGWVSALGIPCALKGSGLHGGFVVGNSTSRHTFERTVLSHSDLIHKLCLITHRKIETLRTKQDRTLNVPAVSVRESEVLALLSKGMRPKQIAHSLKISESAVRLYLKNARNKLGAKTKEEAIALFLENKP